MRPDGSVVLITGGAGGLGEATARHLHAQGAHVVLFDLAEQRAKDICTDLGRRADFFVGDGLDEEDSKASVAFAGSLGELRGVVATAGGGAAGSRTVKRDGAPHDLALFRQTMDMNVVTTFNTVRLAAAHMGTLEPWNEDGERGAMVLTASLAGYEGQIGQMAYATAKAALIGMTLVVARDLSAMGIRVNAIAPGTMDTRAWEGGNPEVKASLEAKVPFPRRFGRPSEYAELAAHLLTNGYMNGHVARLDGAIRFDPK